MLHPSYHDLMSKVNSEVETGEAPIVSSRYSIVLATAKRARQLIDGVEPLTKSRCPKPLSVAIDELDHAKIRILSEEEAAEARKRQEEGGEADAAESEDAAVTESDDIALFSGEELSDIETEL